MKKMNSCLVFSLYALLINFFMYGCATFSQSPDVLAVVDNEPVTIKDLSYSLEVAHRKQDLAYGSEMNIPSYVQKLVDDKLVVHEARRMQLDQNQAVQQKMDAYLLRESVVRLHDEEILQKISVSDDDVVSFYNKRYQQFYVDFIESDSEEKINDVLEQLKNGADFQKLSKDYPVSSYTKNSEGRVELKGHSIETQLQEILFGLSPGENSDVIPKIDKYFIVQLIDRQDPPIENLEKIRGQLKKYLKKQKEAERSKEYLAELHEQSDVNIDRDILEEIRLDIEKGEREKWLEDDRPLVTVYDAVLPVRVFAEKVTEDFDKSKDTIINGWLDMHLVDHAALNRHYEKETVLSEQIGRYEDQLLKNMYINKIVLPQIKVSEELLRQYYDENKEHYTDPPRFKIEQLVLKAEEEAREIFNSLKEGGDFTWLAQNMIEKSSGSKEVASEWFTKGSLDPAVGEIIDTLEPGDFSPVLKVLDRFKIIRLLEKAEGKTKGFNKIRDILVRHYIENQREKIYRETVDKLKEYADVKVNEKAVEEFGKLFQKK
ncbi:MAG: peptidylprolyl isomerase [Nitrospirota bacterium]